MSFSDSMFLFEIIIEELQSFIDCKEFYIQSQFADVFILNLKDPNDLDTLLPKVIKLNKKSKVRKKASKKLAADGKIMSGQSVLFTSKIDSLITTMKNFPIELALYNRDDPESKVGSTHIPWSPAFIDYLYKLRTHPDLSPVHLSGGYNVYDDFTSKRMATIKLNIKLSHLQDKLTTSFRSLSEHNQNTFIYTGFNSKPTTVLSTIKEAPFNFTQETGIIKTIYSGGKRKYKSRKSKTHKKKYKEHNREEKELEDIETIKQPQTQVEKLPLNLKDIYTPKSSKIHLVQSDTDLDKNKKIELLKSKSCSAIKRDKFNILNYIFGDMNKLCNQVYCVGYFTVENDNNVSDTSSKSKGSPQSSSPIDTSGGQGTPKANYKFKICDKDCPSMKDNVCAQSHCSLDLPEEAADLITITKCKQVACDQRKQREPEPLPDERIILEKTDNVCCDNVRDEFEPNRRASAQRGKVEQVVGGVTAKMKIDDEECFCSCRCTFGYIKKTTYCDICRGYKYVGEDFVSAKNPADRPNPCPLYHKLVDKNKLRGTLSTSGSDTKKKDDQRKLTAKIRNTESEKEPKTEKKKDDRFKFNYGYAAPKIGHSNCAAPCTGSLDQVPKNMGWLWSAEDVPGIKFRPLWRPGATNKHVVRLLRMAKNPGEVLLAKKKKKDDGKPKKRVVRPLLAVSKKDGEYTVTMETMKGYAKARAVNQQPFEDKPVLTYTIGRTEEENRERQKKKDRAKRRLERDQRNYIQSAFTDMCKEICLKTYQQALGILPDAEDPECACYPKYPGPDRTNLDVSCSCSEDSRSLASDTDSDEWLVEFTPPNATYKPSHVVKKVVKVDNMSQYSYLDYRVKLLDRFGNQVQRFFKGPSGKIECSDLGGFWSPDHKWLEINVDGFIGPDGKWAPMSFIGPNGDQVDCENGKFQSGTRWYVVGVDGFVDCNGKWKFYPGGRGMPAQTNQKQAPLKKTPAQAGGGEPAKKGDKGKLAAKKSETAWSCFGDAKPEDLTQLGIMGHGHDKKLLTEAFKKMIAGGAKISMPSNAVPRFKGKRRKTGPDVYDSRTYFTERETCRHPVPTDKGVLAVDDEGNKTYFRLKTAKNKRPGDRVAHLQNQGISLSSFHVPCMHSFINQEVMKKQQFDRIIALSQRGQGDRNAATQTGAYYHSQAKSRIAQ